MKKYCFGVDIGGTTVKMGLFGTDGTLMEKWEIVTRKENAGEFILGDVAASIKEKMAEKSITADEVAGAGLGVPGPVMDDGTVKGCINLGWGDVAVVKKMSELTGLSVKAGNDANVAALGELWQGGGKGHNSMVMVTLGTGVGGGVIVDGKIINGIHGAGGEIGHMPIVYDGDTVCNCGKKGCLEGVASATGIVREAKKAIAKADKKTSLTSFDPLTAKDVFDEAKKGDEVAVGVAEQLGFYLGTALSHIGCVVDPELFLIGGGVSKAGTYLTDMIVKYYKEKCFRGSTETPVVLAKLGNDAGIYGAAKLVID